MKSITRLYGIALLVCVSFLPGQLASAPADTSTAEATVAELTAMVHAFLANSATEAAHAKFWADDLVYTSSNGSRFGKADIMQGFAEADSGDEHAAAVAYSGADLKVQVFGNTAVVTFRLLGSPVDGSAAAQYFNTGTFLKRDGAWRVVAWQATVIPASATGAANPD